MLNTTNIIKKSHKEWRKEAKKLRRKKIRQKLAKLRESKLAEELSKKLKDPTYLTLLAEQKALELFQQQEEETVQNETNEKWLRSDLLCQKKFAEKQKKIKAVEKAKEEQRMIIKQEFEAEQKRLEKIKEDRQRLIEEKQKEFEILMKKIDDYIDGTANLPDELKIPLQTNPGKQLCTFFIKTATCRFGDKCSRNHSRPGISNILLIPNFFTHIRLEQSKANEYGSDLCLEYEESELYKEFNNFYFDVISEFEQYGNIDQFCVCSNHEPHIRGNVYIEYKSKRDALKAYRIFQGRYYAGRMLNIEFCSVLSWKSAICGLSFNKTCPKGRNCNFLHIFKNPNNKYPIVFKNNSEFYSQRFGNMNSSQHQSRDWQSERINKNSWSDDNSDSERKYQNMKWSSDEADQLNDNHKKRITKNEFERNDLKKYKNDRDRKHRRDDHKMDDTYRKVAKRNRRSSSREYKKRRKSKRRSIIVKHSNNSKRENTKHETRKHKKHKKKYKTTKEK